MQLQVREKYDILSYFLKQILKGAISKTVTSDSQIIRYKHHLCAYYLFICSYFLMQIVLLYTIVVG